MKYNLSELNDLIRNRRTVMPENYTSRKVHREMVELILTNATWAPTHGNTQPWRFKVFMEDGLKLLAEKLPELYQKHTPADQFKQQKFERFRNRAQSVSVMIAVCMERDPTAKIAEIEEVEAVACAVQNMMLTCTAYGLGSFWSTPKFIYTTDMNVFLGLGEKDKCLGLFYMGYTDAEWPKSHRKPLEYVAEFFTA